MLLWEVGKYNENIPIAFWILGHKVLLNIFSSIELGGKLEELLLVFFV